MREATTFISKLLLLSLAISLLIKYAAPALPVGNMDVYAAVMVLLPAVVMGCIMGIKQYFVKSS
ncbi:hypothetical protein [Calothrix sp. 336/3]|uniref:hypothetical protein n=1 Tax=Calothrix sp. 336/3 TaxID=1337936 RepID=UPI0004E38A21|nr:hypothetical protein [Calothrix sp. 336/3]AKG23903.1 hypothetical protein IJ00_23670 [Calothrix sp. 336/3]